MATTMRAQVPMDKPLSPTQRRHFRQQVRKRLEVIQPQLAQLTDRTHPSPKTISFYDDGVLDSPRFCGTWENTRLQIATQVLERPLLLDSVLYRETFLVLLPSIIRSVRESGDLGLLCAYTHLPADQQDQFIRVWQVVSPRRHFGDITYNAPLNLPLFNRVTQGKLLRNILPYFDDLEPAVTPLTSREYVELLESFMLNYVSPLNEQELKILHLLQEHPLATIKDLQGYSSLSAGSVSYYLTNLREKVLLSKFYRVNFPRIRLNHIAVLAFPAPGSRINRYIEHCPYLRKIHRFGGAGAPYLISYILPRLRLRRLQEWLQELVGMGHLTRFRIYPLDGSFNSFNLRSYLAYDSDTPVAERFRWVAWIRFLRDVLIREGYGEVLEQPYIYHYSPPFVEPVKLEPLDYQLLAYLSPEQSAEKLAQQLGKSVHTIRKHQRDLFKQQIVFGRPGLSMYHLGLNETIFVMIEGNENVVQNFLAGCREAPMCGGSIFSHPTAGCIVAFALPTGLALKVGQELGRLFLEQDEFDAAVFYGSGAKDFSMAPVLRRCKFNFSQNQWTWHREYFPTAFDHIDSFSTDFSTSSQIANQSITKWDGEDR